MNCGCFIVAEEGRDWVCPVQCRWLARSRRAVCGMGLLNLDQETAFGSGEASSVLAAGGEQEKQPRICRNHDQDQDQVRLTSIKRARNVPAASAVRRARASRVVRQNTSHKLCLHCSPGFTAHSVTLWATARRRTCARCFAPMSLLM